MCKHLGIYFLCYTTYSPLPPVLLAQLEQTKKIEAAASILSLCPFGLAHLHTDLCTVAFATIPNF